VVFSPRPKERNEEHGSLFALARNTLELTRYQNFRIQGAIMSVKKEASGRRSVQVEVEVPGTPEEVWQAIATGPGISSWFVPAEFEERDGKPLARRPSRTSGALKRAEEASASSALSIAFSPARTIGTTSWKAPNPDGLVFYAPC